MATIALIHSMLLLDTTTPNADTTASNLSQQHALVMSGFPTVRGVPARHALSVLYQVRPTLPQRVELSVQSPEEPNWSCVPDFVTKTTVEHIALDLEEGQVWEFSCDANPSVRPPGRSRQFLQSLSDQQKWWERRSDIHGFQTQSLTIQGLGIRRGDQGLALSVVRFSGQFVVRDAVRVADSFRRGVGPGKAFGCGLLRLAG